MGYGWDHMGDGMGWGFGGLWMILLVVAAVVAVAVLLKGVSGSSGSIDSPREKSPLDVLKERYARGDIGREEFEQKRRDLQ